MAAVQQNSKEIYIFETEKRPNLYAANVLAGVVGVIAIVFMLNEVGIFEVSKPLVRMCLIVSVSLFVVMQIIVHKAHLITSKMTKYLIMFMVLFLVMTLTVLLNIHAVLAFVLPILLATQYRCHRISVIALFGSCICCAVAPILSFLLGTFSVNFLTGYIEAFCGVTVSVSPGNGINNAQAISRIMLYWSLPQMLTLGAFGFILYSTTKSGIDSVKNRVQVVDLSNDLSRKLKSITDMQEKMLCTMSDIIENRDIETGGHVRRTIEIVRLLMEAMEKDPQSGVSPEFCNNVIRSAPMHDLGKISIPDAILHKPGKLTYNEYEIVKQHPITSARIISEALTGIEDEQLIAVAKNIALYHHEKMDGTGYPMHLTGVEIPLEARVMAIADVYDALVSERCYKAPMSFDEAFETIEKLMGTHFDPGLNCYFLVCREKIEEFYSA